MMTSFDPTKNHKPSDEWNKQALQSTQENSLQWQIIGGIVLGTLTAGAASPITGVLVAGYFIWDSWQKASGIQRNQRAIIESSCIAQVLEGDDFINYAAQIGKDAVMAQLNYAAERNLPMSDIAMDYFEDNQQRALSGTTFAQPALPQSGYSPEQAITPNSPTVLQEFASTITETGNYNPDYSIDIVKELTSRISNTLIIGVPGCGKGMLLANAIREIKRKYPAHKIFVIDPKGDADEAAYFDGIVDRYEALECEHLPAKEVTNWVKWCFKEYHEYADKNGKCLLILDEGVIVGLKFGEAKDNFIKGQISNTASAGDKKGKNIWVCSQTPYVTPLGLDLSSTSQMTVVAMLRETGIVDQWTKAGVKLAKATQEELTSLLKKSEAEIGEGRGRVVYFGKTGKWYAMPKLHNYSPYDRDTGTRASTLPAKDALTRDERAALKTQIAKQQPPTLIEESSAEPGTNFVLGLVEKTTATTWEQFILEDMKLQPDMVDTTLDAIALTLEEHNRIDLAKLRSKNPSEDFKRWLKGLKKKPTDEQVKKRMTILTGKDLDERAVKMIRQKFEI